MIIGKTIVAWRWNPKDYFPSRWRTIDIAEIGRHTHICFGPFFIAWWD